MWQNKKVLVTGGAGVIGRVLVKKLEDFGADVLSIDLQPATFDKAKHYTGDVLDFLPTCAKVPEIVFHLAALFGRTQIEPEFFNDNFYGNVLLSHRLLEFPERWEKFIFASSYLVYDPSLYIWHVGHSLQEDDSIMPRNIVGAAKYYTENELEFLGSCGKLNSISARIFRVYGRGSKDFISRMVRQALSGESITLYDESARFDYIFADDVAEGLIKLAETSHSGPVNLACGRSRSIGEALDIIGEYLPMTVLHSNQTIIPLENSRADMTLFKDLTSWIPTTPLEVGIRKVIEYERERLQDNP